MAQRLTSTSLVVLLALVSILFAAAALVILGSPSTAPNSSSSGGGGGGSGGGGNTALFITLPPLVWGLLFLSPLLSFFAVMIWRRLTQHGRFPWEPVLVLATASLLMLFLLAHGGGGPSSTGSVGFGHIGGTGNNSSGTSNNTSTNHSGGSTGGANATTPAFSVNLPGYLPWAVAVALAVVVAALALPGVAARLAEGRTRVRGGGLRPGDREQIAAAMGEAVKALEEGADPRATIVGLYLSLLVRLSPIASDLAFETADEIRRLHLGPLGVSPSVAERLTRLFEEARYSTHPMSAESVATAREAIRAAERSILQAAAA